MGVVNYRSPKISIVEAADACKKAFAARLDLLLSKSGIGHDVTEDQLARFNTWCSNTGVFAAGHASLDYRLRDAEDMQDLVLSMLEILTIHVVEGK